MTIDEVRDQEMRQRRLQAETGTVPKVMEKVGSSLCLAVDL